MIAGSSLPDQLSVAGFDDTTLARTVWPPLTTIHQPMFELGPHRHGNPHRRG
jgi:LacI family transcriptional regulator